MCADILSVWVGRTGVSTLSPFMRFRDQRIEPMEPAVSLSLSASLLRSLSLLRFLSLPLSIPLSRDCVSEALPTAECVFV